MSESEFEEAIKNAFWEEKKEALLASELEKRIMKKTGISRATFYRRLAELVESGHLLKDVTKRRNTAYRLNYNAMLLRLEILSDINKRMQPHEIEFLKNETREADLLEKLGSEIAALSLWALLEQIGTGEPAQETVNYYLSYIGGAQALLKRAIMRKETPWIEHEKEIALYDPKAALGKFPEYEQALKRFSEALRNEKLFPRAKDFDKLAAKIRAGKSDFKIMASKEGS
jgi:Fe2+ or Zn2+ uptake regulation protein